MRNRLLLAFAGLLAVTPVAAQTAALPTIEEKTAGMRRLDGFLPVYWDERGGRLWLEVPLADEELIFIASRATGMGSNDIGLDRSQVGEGKIVRFDRVGPKLLLVQPNYAYRADSPDSAEQRAVRESFAQSVLWGFTVAAATGGRSLVDATDFVLADLTGVAEVLRASGQGSYAPDASRGAPYLSNTRVFPRNTEIEATLTFTGGPPGAWTRGVTPTPAAITLRQHLSFVALPEPGYRPRANDPGAGYFGVEYADYASPIGEPLAQRLIIRHRLQKKDPAAALSDPVRPIVYYLDRGAPEPVRSALLDGARWWSHAFEALGYRDAFRVELLPEGADPMDVRYNVIQWVHRATRGWSYGGAVVDPRTGEVIKAAVQLGSLRVRQDYLLAEGLLDPYVTGTEDPVAPLGMALARLRQLAAHEVGHSLGLAHNYIASTQGRASVMDYPHPLVRLAPDGGLTLDSAYAVGLGAWDSVAIAYGYMDPPARGPERELLAGVLREARARGLTFLTDGDARPAGSVHPEAHLWDNGVDAAAELTRVMDVRRVALTRFGETAIRAGRPWATLEEVLVPVYLHHRYQLEATVKLVGGQWYSYAARGDGQVPRRPVPAADQKRALTALLRTLTPAELTLPRPVLAVLPPRPNLWDPHRELFRRTTGLAFDPVAPAMAAADLTVALLFDTERAARLVLQPALEPGAPGLAEVLKAVVSAAFGPTPRDPYEAEVARGVRYVVADRLVRLAAAADLPQARAIALAEVEALQRRMEALRARPSVSAADRAQALALAGDLRRFLEHPRGPADTAPAPLAPPPGSPIGDE
ncbi:MAG: zinc-dependent metalloprotease [Gemmatimonadetes bacterium]|nr:zinc-dependent metalloprotease [Gemmatimonadota bacterium]